RPRSHLRRRPRAGGRLAPRASRTGPAHARGVRPADDDRLPGADGGRSHGALRRPAGGGSAEQSAQCRASPRRDLRREPALGQHPHRRARPLPLDLRLRHARPARRARPAGHDRRPGLDALRLGRRDRAQGRRGRPERHRRLRCEGDARQARAADGERAAREGERARRLRRGDREGARAGVSVLLFVEPGDELSLQALSLAQQLGDVRAVTIEGSYQPAPWAAALAAQDANVTAIDGDTVTRIRWGGSLLEQARLYGAPRLLTVAPHTQPAAEPVEIETLAAADDGSPEVLETVSESGGGVSLRDAKVVVSGGRGVGSAEAFDIIEELAALLGGAVGCSRVVTSAGWRPHTDQVGQTGTKISADLYVACGISGATQHIAGAKGAKKILAINSDPEAPIMASADYAVIGDLHEVVPAISEELRKVRGS